VFGPFVDETDGVTPQTSVSAPTAARIWKNGVTSTINLSTGRTPAWTHDGDGFYTVGSIASDVDTEGALEIEVTDAATHLPVWKEFEVITQQIRDSLVLGTDNLKVDTVEVLGTAQTANDNGADINAILTDTADMQPRVVAIETDTETTLDTLIKDIPTTAEFEARTLAAADYVVTTDTIAGVATCTTNTDMRGTDDAALASVVGALDNAAAAGEVTTADTLMQYLKQLINILIGTPGIGAFPAEAAPANAVSLAEVIRAIHADVTGLNGSAMVGTNGANTVVPDVAGTGPTVAQMNARTQPTADYFDPAADTVALVTAITNDVGITQAGADKVWSTGTRALTDKADFALSSASRAAIWDETEGITGDTHSFEKILATIFMFLFHEMNITDSSGAMQVRNSGDTGNVITATITDDDTTTDRTKAVIP